MSAGPTPSRRGWFLMAALAAVVVGVGILLWSRWPGTRPAAPLKLAKEDPQKRYQREIRYNANLSLAVKGSKDVRLDLLREMLDEDRQLHNFRVRLNNDQEVSDENSARKLILNTLKAVVEWHNKLGDVNKVFKKPQQAEQLQAVYAAIDKLAKDSPNAAVRQEALRTQKALKLG